RSICLTFLKVASASVNFSVGWLFQSSYSFGPACEPDAVHGSEEHAKKAEAITNLFLRFFISCSPQLYRTLKLTATLLAASTETPLSDRACSIKPWAELGPADLRV